MIKEGAIYPKRCVSCTVRFNETVPELNLKFVYNVKSERYMKNSLTIVRCKRAGGHLIKVVDIFAKRCVGELCTVRTIPFNCSV